MSSESLSSQVLQANAQAFEAGEYECAYHLLMGALHLADHASDMELVEQIRAAATVQERKLEAMRPPHNLSTSQATVRGQTSVFRSLATHIDAVRLRIESARQLAAKRASAGDA